MKGVDFIQTERVDGHIWGRYKSDGYESCRNCMMVRRHDKKNSPCRGKVKLRKFEDHFTGL